VDIPLSRLRRSAEQPSSFFFLGHNVFETSACVARGQCRDSGVRSGKLGNDSLGGMPGWRFSGAHMPVSTLRTVLFGVGLLPFRLLDPNVDGGCIRLQRILGDPFGAHYSS
jgi:hypothetical protein